MDFKRVLQVLTNPYWTPEPLRWKGIDHLALSGAAGKFNLAWWATGLQQPPLTDQTHVTAAIWAVMVGPNFVLERRSLEHHAAMISQVDFESLLRRHRHLLREQQGFHPLHRLDRTHAFTKQVSP